MLKRSSLILFQKCRKRGEFPLFFEENPIKVGEGRENGLLGTKYAVWMGSQGTNPASNLPENAPQCAKSVRF